MFNSNKWKKFVCLGRIFHLLPLGASVGNELIYAQSNEW